MQYFLEFQWLIFFTLEMLSIVFLILFGIFRYAADRRTASTIMLWLFITCILLEAAVAFITYTETKEIATFQIVIAIFILYACTLGINDFKKLDRWMRQKIGKWRNVELLTAKDYAILSKQKDPRYMAKKYRRSSVIHLILFVTIQSILLMIGTDSFAELKMYLSDFSWVDTGSYESSPYNSQIAYNIGIIWTIVFVVDFLYSWSYTLFPSSPKKS